MALERNEGDSDEHDSQQGNDGLWRNHAVNCKVSIDTLQFFFS